jgi:ABC-type polysaccharide/polyol phosphate export permease
MAVAEGCIRWHRTASIAPFADTKAIPTDARPLPTSRPVANSGRATANLSALGFRAFRRYRRRLLVTNSNEASAGGQSTSLRAAWAIQRRVLWALLLREILTRYGRHNIGFMWLFVEPMLFTLGVTALWTATDSIHGSKLPIIAFAVTGYSSVLLWRNMPSRCVDALEPNRSLLYHRNVRVFDVFMTRLALEAAGASISFVVLSVFFIAIGQMSPPEDVLQVAGGWLMLVWFGFSLGLTMGATAQRYEIVEKIWHPLSYLLFPLSGAAFLMNSIPSGAREVLLYLPMVSGVEYMREGYFGSQIVAHYDIGYMAVCNLLMSFFGLRQLTIVAEEVTLE